MSSTSTAGTGFLRLLTRLVLGTAFFFAGWHACFQDVAFSPEDIRLLEGVPVAPIEVALLGAPAAAPKPVAPKKAGEAPKSTPPAAAKAPAPADTPPAASSPLQPIGPLSFPGTVDRAAAERLALSLRKAGVGDFAEPLAWAAAVASLLGGVLVLVGLLTRFWALTMAVMLGASFWFVSVVDAGLFDQSPFQWWAQNQDAA